MATYAKTKRKMQRDYPSLFATELNVIENLFFSYGTGNEWKNGEIINIFDQPTNIIRQARKKNREAFIQTYLQKIKGQPPERWELYDYPPHGKNRSYSIREHRLYCGVVWDFVLHNTVPRSIKNFPLDRICKYSPITQIPSDVTLSWRKATEIAFAIGFEALYAVGESNPWHHSTAQLLTDSYNNFREVLCEQRKAKRRKSVECISNIDTMDRHETV